MPIELSDGTTAVTRAEQVRIPADRELCGAELSALDDITVDLFDLDARAVSGWI